MRSKKFVCWHFWRNTHTLGWWTGYHNLGGSPPSPNLYPWESEACEECARKILEAAR